MTGSELTTISQAQRALAEAKTIAEIKGVHDVAAAMQKYARAKGLGIEDENAAAEVVVRAERLMGLELIRLRDNDEFRHGGHRSRDRATLSLADLSLTADASSHYQNLARMDDDEFERTVARAYELGKRLARVDFYRVALESLPFEPAQPKLPGGYSPAPQPRRVDPEAPEPEPEEPKGAPRIDVGPIEVVPWMAAADQLVEAADSLTLAMEQGWPTTPDLLPKAWAEEAARIERAIKLAVVWFRKVEQAREQAALEAEEAYIDAE